jgi:hemerythrin-like domain-containing protein
MAKLSGKRLDEKSKEDIVQHGRAYIELLTAHIQKENEILYPIADEILSEDDQRGLAKGFKDVEEKIMGPGVHEKYHKMIEEWERRLR